MYKYYVTLGRELCGKVRLKMSMIGRLAIIGNCVCVCVCMCIYMYVYNDARNHEPKIQEILS
jgi:hypothetical protein